MTTGIDKHYYPIELPAGATIRIGATSVALTSGIYYTHASSFFPATFTSVYAMICARLITVLGGVWTVEPFRPSGYAASAGLRLKVTGLSPGALNLASTSPMVRRLLGYAEDDVGSYPFVGGQLAGPFAAFGAWSPWSCLDGRATSKDSGRSRQLASSSDAPEDAVFTIWRDRRVRLLFYEMVYGPYVYGERATIDEIAAVAGCATGDKNNCLYELWRSSALIRRDILSVYDLDDLDLTISPLNWESSRIATIKAIEDLEGIATRDGRASDLWQVRLPLIVTGGNYAL